MPQVEVIFPGIPTDYTYHNPETGQDEQMVEWTFSAVVDGRPETLSGVFAPSVSQERAAHWIKQEVMLAADESGTGEGIQRWRWWRRRQWWWHTGHVRQRHRHRTHQEAE